MNKGMAAVLLGAGYLAGSQRPIEKATGRLDAWNWPRVVHGVPGAGDWMLFILLHPLKFRNAWRNQHRLPPGVVINREFFERSGA